MDLAADCDHLVFVYSLASAADTFGQETTEIREAIQAARQESILSTCLPSMERSRSRCASGQNKLPGRRNAPIKRGVPSSTSQTKKRKDCGSMKQLGAKKRRGAKARACALRVAGKRETAFKPPVAPRGALRYKNLDLWLGTGETPTAKGAPLR